MLDNDDDVTKLLRRSIPRHPTSCGAESSIHFEPVTSLERDARGQDPRCPRDRLLGSFWKPCKVVQTTYCQRVEVSLPGSWRSVLKVGVRMAHGRRTDELPGCDDGGRGPLFELFSTVEGEYSGIDCAMIDEHQRGFPRIRGSQCD